MIVIVVVHYTGASANYIIDGYCDKISVYPNEMLTLFINAAKPDDDYTLKIYDLQGKVIMSFKSRVLPQKMQTEKPYENGFGYNPTTRVTIPNLRSGIYLIENKIPFVVRAKRQTKITVVYPSNTVNAYSPAGGKSLYGYNSTDNLLAKKVSFKRPLELPIHAEDFLRWICKQDYNNISYISDLDMDDFKSIRNSSLLIIPGHSEYWTFSARKNFDRFIAEGNDALILSGNTMWWQVRYNESKDQLICYRVADEDPIQELRYKTILWNDKRLDYPIINSIGADFALGGYGRKHDNGWNGFKIVSQSPLLEGTTLDLDSILSCPSDEVDSAPISGFLNGVPVPDVKAIGIRAEIIGFDHVARNNLATWIVFQKTPSSGIVINTASTDWCSYKGIGSNDKIKTITSTMIRKLLNKENVFSSPQIDISSDVVN